MTIHEQIELFECPCCGGPGLLEEEHGWCFYVMCLDCGGQTASVQYEGEADRLEAARKAAHLWNTHKVIRMNPGE